MYYYETSMVFNNIDGKAKHKFKALTIHTVLIDITYSILRPCQRCSKLVKWKKLNYVPLKYSTFFVKQCFRYLFLTFVNLLCLL